MRIQQHRLGTFFTGAFAQKRHGAILGDMFFNCQTRVLQRGAHPIFSALHLVFEFFDGVHRIKTYEFGKLREDLVAIVFNDVLNISHVPNLHRGTIPIGGMARRKKCTLCAGESSLKWPRRLLK